VATDSFTENNTRSERVGLFIKDSNKVFVLETVNLNGRDETSQLFLCSYRAYGIIDVYYICNSSLGITYAATFTKILS
jgi:hypothetical protein